MKEIEIVRGTLESLEFTGWGLSSVAGLEPEGSGGLPCAATLYKAYVVPAEADPLLERTYDEAAFHDTLEATREAGFRELEKLRGRLDTDGIGHWTVPLGQDPETLIGAFSAKRAAVLAGLGWIGRSTLFVTPEFGPRVKLFTVLLDVEPPEEPPEVRVSCGACRARVDACAHGFISGKAWRASRPRDDLFDAFGCSSRREELGIPIGRKHYCGLCLLACPFGAPGG